MHKVMIKKEGLLNNMNVARKKMKLTEKTLR